MQACAYTWDEHMITHTYTHQYIRTHTYTNVCTHIHKDKTNKYIHIAKHKRTDLSSADLDTHTHMHRYIHTN